VRIAIVSDVHGNLNALDAVLDDLGPQQPDLVLHGGDLALHGPRPAEVIDRIRELGWPGVLGNTDQCFWDLSGARESIRPLLEVAVPIAREQIGPERVQWLRDLPLGWKGDGVALVHAVPGDPWPVVGPDAGDEVLTETFGPLGEPLAVYGHIHIPYIRRLEKLTVANSGSAGMPADGDWRASYLLIRDGEPSLRRVEYDLERELSELATSGSPIAEALAEGRRQGRIIFPKAG
jgi:putative phosphoesterase